jgi:type II secretory pathway predicted ATPase ExeA
VISPARRDELMDALRRGTVPQRSLDLLAVGLDRFEEPIQDELARTAGGIGGFKAIRGEYGSGKTFFVRWIQERARRMNFVTAEVQISENETPLYKLNTVYRRLMERLSTREQATGAFRSIVDLWLLTLQNDVLEEGQVSEEDEEGLQREVEALMSRRLSRVAERAPMFAQALRGYMDLHWRSEDGTAEAVLAWIAGQPNVAAAAKREAGVKGEIDHDGALTFLKGLLAVLRDSGHAGLVLVLDEVETLQRMRSDVRDKSLNALRQFMDELSEGLFPGLYLVLTGTPAFFEGPQGVRRLEPLAQRLHTDFSGPPEFDNPRAPQVRLPGFTQQKLELLGRRVRDFYADGSSAEARIRAKIDDDYVREFAFALVGELGGKVGVAPRIFLRKLVTNVLDKVELFDTFDPRQHAGVDLAPSELTREEAAAMAHESVEDVALDLPDLPDLDQ